MQRFTLTDFALDKNNLLAWLNQDGNPPTAMVPCAANGSPYRSHSFYGWGKKVAKPVTDLETLDVWWNDYRAALYADFQKSPLNKHKPYSDRRFMTDCLASLGIRGGTVEARRARAVAARPDLYTDATTVKAAAAAEAARVAELCKLMNLTAPNDNQAA
jgi:hypothetical protein